MAARETTVPMITGCLQASSKSFGDITETSVVVGAFVTAKNRFIYLHKSILFLYRKQACTFQKDLEKNEAKLFQDVHEERLIKSCQKMELIQPKYDWNQLFLLNKTSFMINNYSMKL